MAFHSRNHFIPEESIVKPRRLLDLSLEESERCLMRVLQDPSPMVVQCPYFTHMLGRFRWEDMLIVMVQRNSDDIYRSREKAKLGNGLPVDWGRAMKRLCDAYEVDSTDDPVQLVYDRWAQDCRKVPWALTLNYEDFRGHPLWTDEAGRKGWHVAQSE